MSTSLYTGQCIAVFGTASLQRYIFQSNRLKENIGASYLVKYWLDEGLLEAIKQAGRTVDTNAWDAYKANPSMSPPEKPVDTTKRCNLIYVGGGNAALLCKSQEIAKDAVKVWSRKLLENAPGLRVAVGYADVENSLAEGISMAHCWMISPVARRHCPLEPPCTAYPLFAPVPLPGSQRA